MGTPVTPYVEVDLARQRLRLFKGVQVLADYSVSTARNGGGELYNSECTPRGKHVIRAKIGCGYPLGTVLIERRPSGEIYTAELRRKYPKRDWILTRILWLSGVEPGRNRGGEVDTLRRCVYIHGAPDDVNMGVPGSRGCIRMRNADVVELFDRVSIGTPVLILENS
ncbi:MAG: L,D-transpeptidase [Gammaproteobacteria bacterium]|nr:L,D-transpeptidase [Gammaproteobacteria bacterium]MCI0590612.1 L,D-transpeptidase [Gammaproteobacteria bacterium]